MLTRRLPVGVLLPAGLVLLVGTLATLQYRWLGQVSEAERDELSRSLEQRARAFADDFDLELSRAFLAFQLGESPLSAVEATSIEPRLASWRAVAQFPDLVGAVYLARSGENGPTLSHYDTDRAEWQDVDWPDKLEPVQKQLALQVTRSAGGGAPIERKVVSLTTSALVRDVPALLVPVVDAIARPEGAVAARLRLLDDRPADVIMALGVGRTFLVVELDREYMTGVMLPAIADRHFGQDEADRYRIAVVDDTGGVLLARGLAAGASITDEAADVSRSFFTIRLDLARPASGRRDVFAWQTETTRTTERAPDTRQPLPEAGTFSIVVGRAEPQVERAARAAGTAWRLLVQHAAGSLDAAVAQARRRNLWLSFGILSVLAASVGLIVLNARRSERLAAQQMDFVATVSHELRTPLAVIRSAAQNLSAGVVHDAEQARRYGALIETEGRRLTDMVEQVLEYAGLSGHRRLRRAAAVDPGELVRDAMVGSLELCRHEGVDLDVQVAPGLPLVEADEDAVRRALGNLVTNALKYASDGRWIGVTVRRAGTARAPEVQIAVTDRGRGIDADELPHIFEPFYRGRYATERQIHGNGLGLSLVRRIAEAHGGRVTVATAQGQGTTFTLHLPGIDADASLQPFGAPAADAGPHA